MKDKYERRFAAITKKPNKSAKDFIIISRIRNFLEARRLNMEYFSYDGAVYNDTLDFCRNRAGKVFSITEMMNWVNSPDRPKNSTYDPIIDLGGNNCNKDNSFCEHFLSFIDRDLAISLRPDIAKNIHEEAEIKIDYTNQLSNSELLIFKEKKEELLINASFIQLTVAEAALALFLKVYIQSERKIEVENGIPLSFEDRIKSICKMLKETLSIL